METVIEQAMTFAIAAHASQTRKYIDMPYIVHPMEVAARVMRLPGATEILPVAFLFAAGAAHAHGGSMARARGQGR